MSRTSNQRIPFIHYSLTVVLAGLFAMSFALNRSQYRAAQNELGGRLQVQLHRDLDLLHEHVLAAERTEFRLMAGNIPFDVAMARNMFQVHESRAYPAGLEELMPSARTPRETADKSLAIALEHKTKGRRLRAEEYLKVAAGIETREHRDLLVKASALFNILELNNFSSPYAIYGLLAIMDGEAEFGLTRDEKEFFRKALSNNVRTFARDREQSKRIWATADQISRSCRDKSLPLRIMFDDRLLSVNIQGSAVLIPLSDRLPFELSRDAPRDAAVVLEVPFARQLFASVSSDKHQVELGAIRRRYHLANGSLAVMCLLAVILVVTLFNAVGKERELVALRSRFLATVSHELRTPIGLVRLYAETLNRGKLDEEKRESYARSILVESERLTGLVNNVMDFSRLEQGSYRLNIQKVDLSHLCGQVLESFKFRLGQEEFELKHEIQEGIMADIDPLAFSQIVFNLMDNALKYSGESHVVEVALRVDMGVALLSVRDQGLGIPDTMKDRVFDAFERVDDQRVSAKRGSGIGLSVSQQLARQMAGAITILDNVPAGTEFRVTVPLA